MNTQVQDIQKRTQAFVLRAIRLYTSLPREPVSQVIGKQMLRSSTSVGAHVREGKHSRSSAEMLSKVSVALQELEETRYWMELLAESGLVKRARLESLIKEVDELIAILFAGCKTLRKSRV